MKKFITFALVAVLLCAALCSSAFAAEEKVFWVSHFNDSTAEGAGVVFTEPYENCQWWVLFVFAPTGTENVFEVIEVKDGTADGSGGPMDIPEGGFVYGLNTGNDWPTLIKDGGCTGDGSTGLWYDTPTHVANPNFINDNNNAAMADAKATFAVGTKIQITGLDLDTLEMPTSTSDKMWYQADYVCTATYTLYEGDAGNYVPGEGSEEISEEDETSAPAASESKTEESKAPVASDADSSAAPADDAGMPMWVIALIVVAVIAVVAVVVIVIIKKK